MQHRTKRPSPALVVATLALVMATTGSAVAAVDFARNAGAVDGKSAVASGATLRQAAGRLVATQRTGDDRGRIATRYLDLTGVARGTTDTFGRALEVVDRTAPAAPPVAGAAVPVSAHPGLGTLSVSCTDQNPMPARENPAMTLTFTNTAGEAVNLARTVGNGEPLVTALLAGTQTQFTILGSNTFTVHVERRSTNLAIHGAVRQDGLNTATGSCLVYGYSIVIPG
jgi:hypothetical protein